MHGGDIYRNKVNLDFSVNINPLGPPENVMAAMRESLSLVQNYPDPQCRKLREELAGRYGLTKDQVATGNGASELIFALVRAVRPKKALLAAPGFSEYERALRLQGVDITYVSPDRNLAGAIRKARPDLVLIANPNNPTGQMASEGELRRAVRECLACGGVFAVDECFLELSDPGEEASLIPYMEEASGNGDLAVLRAFTKTYSIPGIRIGYMFTSKGLSGKVREQLPDWNCSVPALAAGSACLETDSGYLEKARELIRTERDYLTGKIQGLGIRVFPSKVNYLLLYCEGVPLYERLLSEGILIRDCSDYRGLGRGYFRIAVKRHKENEILIQKLEKIIHGHRVLPPAGY